MPPVRFRSDYQTNTIMIGYEAWEPGDWVVTVAGEPVGQAIGSEREAKVITEWLRTAIWGVRAASQPAADAGNRAFALEGPADADAR